MKARTALLIALSAFALLAVVALAAGPPRPPPEVMKRMIKEANGDPKKLEAMKKRMEMEMRRRTQEGQGAPARGEAAGKGRRGPPGGRPQRGPPPQGEEGGRRAKGRKGPPRNRDATKMPDADQVRDAMMKQRKEIESLRESRRAMQVSLTTAADHPHHTLDGMLEPKAVGPKMFSLADRLVKAAAENQFGVANELVETLDQMVTDLKMQLGRLERGEVDASKRDPSKLVIDEAVNYDTGAEFSVEVTHRPQATCPGAKVGDKLLVQYVGKLAATEQTFVSSLGTKGTYMQLGADTNLDGVDRALEGACPGERRMAMIPGDMAYGEDGLEDADGKTIVPPSATLQFYFDVLRPTPREKEL